MTSLNNGALYLDAESVSRCIRNDWDNLVEAMKRALKSYSAGKVVQPVRTKIPVEKHDGVLFTMPAYNVEDDEVATKLVTVFPQNKERGLSTIQAVILLYEAKNGKLKAILDGDIITEVRTAAASVVASTFLINKHDVLALLGSGAQARSHYQAFCHFYHFKKICLWNINKESALILAEEIKQLGLQCEVCVCDTVEDAVKDADIIVTATMSRKPILKKEWVKDGAHINAVGAPVPEWQELENDLLLSSVIYVDSTEGALAESGDIIHSKAPIYAEIGEVILGTKEAYPKKTTIFKSLGMAVEDVAAAELVYKNYKALNGC